MKRLEREWMYERLDDKKRLRIEFINGVEKFLQHAKNQEEFQVEKKLRCPCVKCKNMKYLNEFEVKAHLISKGFCSHYYDWIRRGELYTPNEEESSASDNTYREMVVDALGSNVLDILEEPPIEEESPNLQMKSFFDMLNAAAKPLFEGSKVSLLEVAARMINLKCEYNLAYRCVDGISSLIEDIIPENNLMTRTFYNTRKILKGLEPHQKIDTCPEGCMLFWKEDALLDKCKKCLSDRYKKTSRGKRVPQKVLTFLPITPRLQRLYTTKHIAGEMRWHKENPRVSGTMAHPSDGDAWKQFDLAYPEFAIEPRNVRLGLCNDGFSPYGQFGKSYSCWPVMVTPYNLPPWLCMKKQFIFLSLIVPGPNNPKKHLDVYLQPLVEELKQLWETGVLTYDVSKKQNFHLKAALIWTINDFSAYGILSGWSTTGHNACPYCMEKTKSFHLPFGKKESWFDCHRQFLPVDHPFRKNRNAFLNDTVEKDRAPPRLSGQEIWERISSFPTIVAGTPEEFKELKKLKNGWSKRSIFWELPYWKSLLIRHNLDVIHIEKNFFEMLINTVMDVKAKTTDTINSRKDLRHFCHLPKLHMRKSGDV